MSDHGHTHVSQDADKKRALLTSWWSDLLPDHSFLLFGPLDPFNPRAAMARLASLPAAPSVYVLLADIDGEATPVYIGKADDPGVRWRQHLDGWVRGTGSY